MNLFLIDAIGPFFKGYEKPVINWSKIPYDHLPTGGQAAEEFWPRLKTDFRKFAEQAKTLGYNGVTLDDLAHLAPHPWHDEVTRQRIEFFVSQFKDLFQILGELDLQPWITADVIALSPAVASRLGHSFSARNSYFYDQFKTFFSLFPEVRGMILRIGESDGLDVIDTLRSELHIRTAKGANLFLKQLLPLAENLEKDVVLRTWTVGAHRIGDLIWHRGRLSEALEGIQSPRFILSMKPGESDFFRHLPLNRAFFRYKGPKILELQARREYEGAGEFPSWIGPECEQLRDELAHAENMRGISVWCQTGGWHRFKRLTFLDDDSLWSGLNAQAAIDIFRHRLTAEQSVKNITGPNHAQAASELLHHTLHVIETLYYIPEFARQKLFFRRVRIPPLLHVYWDSILIHSPVRKLLRHFVKDHESAILESDGAMQRFPRILELAAEIGWPVDDFRFMRDTCALIHLARIYYFSSDEKEEKELESRIRSAKLEYKRAWPKSKRPRYRVKTNFDPSPINRGSLMLLSKVFLRRRRGYRNFLDRIFTLNCLSLLFRLFKNRTQKAIPEHMRQSAMGIDSVFK